MGVNRQADVGKPRANGENVAETLGGNAPYRVIPGVVSCMGTRETGAPKNMDEKGDT